jgi:hypothetical protein
MCRICPGHYSSRFMFGWPRLLPSISLTPTMVLFHHYSAPVAADQGTTDGGSLRGRLMFKGQDRERSARDLRHPDALSEVARNPAAGKRIRTFSTTDSSPDHLFTYELLEKRRPLRGPAGSVVGGRYCSGTAIEILKRQPCRRWNVAKSWGRLCTKCATSDRCRTF